MDVGYIYIYVWAVENLGLRRGDGKKMETSVQGVGVKGLGQQLRVHVQKRASATYLRARLISRPKV